MTLTLVGVVHARENQFEGLVARRVRDRGEARLGRGERRRREGRDDERSGRETEQIAARPERGRGLAPASIRSIPVMPIATARSSRLATSIGSTRRPAIAPDPPVSTSTSTQPRIGTSAPIRATCGSGQASAP